MAAFIGKERFCIYHAMSVRAHRGYAEVSLCILSVV